MFELLVSGDAVVPDHDWAVALCQEEWGLPEVHANWTAAPPGSGGKWSFARLQRNRLVAPTALEILGIPYAPTLADQPPPGYAYLPEIAASQGDRPARNHSTVLSTLDIDAVVDRLTASGGTFRLDPPDPNLPFPRLWVGFSPRHPDRYDPRTDGGLRIEVIPHQPLGMPGPDGSTAASELAPGSPVRVVARTILVDDLPATLTALDTYLGWKPDEQTGDRAVFSFAYPRSATLEVVQPDVTTAEGEFLDRWGPGPFSIRIAVKGLEALQGRFEDRSVPHTFLPALDGQTARLLRPAQRQLGTAFEFIEEPSG